MAYLVELLKQENTGCADCLAKKIGVSRRTILRYLDVRKMTDEGSLLIG